VTRASGECEMATERRLTLREMELTNIGVESAKSALLT
jgi:hypothetical protein